MGLTCLIICTRGVHQQCGNYQCEVRLHGHVYDSCPHTWLPGPKAVTLTSGCARSKHYVIGIADSKWVDAVVSTGARKRKQLRPCCCYGPLLAVHGLYAPLPCPADSVPSAAGRLCHNGAGRHCEIVTRRSVVQYGAYPPL
eukprot:358941-Chlamydomonas_euryale.AAC.1